MTDQTSEPSDSKQNLEPEMELRMRYSLFCRGEWLDQPIPSYKAAYLTSQHHTSQSEKVFSKPRLAESNKNCLLSSVSLLDLRGHSKSVTGRWTFHWSSPWDETNTSTPLNCCQWFTWAMVKNAMPTTKGTNDIPKYQTVSQDAASSTRMWRKIREKKVESGFRSPIFSTVQRSSRKSSKSDFCG